MAERRDKDLPTADERMLEPWFAAAREEPADPPLALLSAILADAASVSAERQETTLDRRPTDRGEAVDRRVFDIVGGWKGLGALAACAAVGFWMGLAGQVTIENGTVWSGSSSVAADATPDDPVGAFYDLAMAEG